MKIYTAPLGESALQDIADCLRNGGIVLMPTDTVYGIAAHLDRPDALQRIVSMKGRDPSKPVQVLAGSVEAVAHSNLSFSSRARQVAEKYWPGALTLVIDRPDGGTEGVRVPDDETACQICQVAGGMIRCTSANTSGEPPALDAQMARDAIPHADILVDGGPVKGGTASTVVRITDSEIRFFRVGPISEADIAACFTASPQEKT
mgnify:CR=1 FL=1